MITRESGYAWAATGEFTFPIRHERPALLLQITGRPLSAIRDGTVVTITGQRLETDTRACLINKKLNAIPRHETRIGALESFRRKLTVVAVVLPVADGYGGYLVGHVH